MNTFQSMVNLAEEYLSSRRKMGFILEREGEELLSFARYADQRVHRGPITVVLAVEWARQSPKNSRAYWARRLSIVRRFATYRAIFDPETEIPPKRFFGHSRHRRSPHIYCKQEIADLLRATSKLMPFRGLRPHTYRVFLGLLSVTGLRVGEALRLLCQDVDLKAGLLTILVTKFKKSRLVPLHPTTVEALSDYMRRRRIFHKPVSSSPFFVTDAGKSLTYQMVLKTFTFLRKRLGWASVKTGSAPRLHDLRHTFAVQRLLSWHKEGADLGRKITALATYLGHVDVKNTYWYLTAVPELLSIAGSRFKNFTCARKGE